MPSSKILKPRLLKFACSACGARLAVPPEMAGMSDHCPKCGAIVTAPSLPPAEAMTAPSASAAPETWSADQLADALRPERRTPVSGPPPEGPGPDLFAGALEPAPKPAKHAHDVLGSILQKPEPAPAAAVPVQTAPAVHAVVPPLRGPDAHVPVQEGAPSALAPRTLSDPREAEEAAMPGMGEVLASRAASNALPAEGDMRTLLHVPFLPVSTPPNHVKRLRRQRWTVAGVAAFLLLDLFVVLWLFRRPLGEWWNGSAKAQAQVSDPAPTDAMPGGKHPTLGVARPGPTSSPPELTNESASQSKPAGKMVQPHAASPTPPGGMSTPPLASLPDGILGSSPASVVPALPVGIPTIAAPTDFSSGSRTAENGKSPAGQAVPMAIPLPGHSNQEVPTATPLTPAGNTGSTVRPPAPTATMTPPPASPGETPPLVQPPTASTVPAPPPVPPPVEGPASSGTAAPSGMASSSQAPPAIQDPTGTPAVNPPRIGRVPQEAQAALKALQGFLDANTWKERIAFVQKPESVRAAMEKYAAKAGDGPVHVDSISFVERYPSKNNVPPYSMFEVSGGALSNPVLVLIEESPKAGTRVDWEAFVEFKDNLLLKFLEDKASPAHSFRVLVRRKHYFDKDVPDVGQKDCFELEQPNAEFEGQVFAPKGSTVGRQLANQLAWGQDMPVIAELAWKSDGKNQWVEITSIVSYGWRG